MTYVIGGSSVLHVVEVIFDSGVAILFRAWQVRRKHLGSRCGYLAAF